MTATWGVLLTSGFYPLYLAWRACAGSTIRHALGWAVAAWGSACLAGLAGGGPAWRYLTLCLTACAGVAVLGARRPGASAWHLVVGGLLATLLLPLLLGLGEVRLQTEQAAFLAGALLVGLGNFLPGRLFVPAAGLLAWCALELMALTGIRDGALGFEPALLLAVPWLGWAVSRVPGGLSRADQTWWLFRQRFGFLWSERMREQFNRAADHAGLGAPLRRGGLVGLTDPAARAKAEGILHALLGRFEMRQGDGEG